jgi:hypothetical protein
VQRPQTIGPYQVVRELGRGGMGVVYEVRHPEIPRPLALKLMPSGNAGAADLLRFQREGELLARVRHPNLLRVHQLAGAAEGVYLVTDLVEGRPLLASSGGRPLEARRAAEVVRAVADGLAAAHALGIVHRDLKPDNVILQPDGTPVLIDFGLARASESQRLTATGALVGTPAYMAPEQALGATAPVDARTDVYGLGAVLFALLAGRAPFDGATLAALLARVIEEEAEWPPDADPALVAIGRVAMARAPADRYPTAVALRDDLDRYLRREAPGALARAAARPRGRRGPALVAAAAVALAVAGAVWGRSGPAASSVEAGAAHDSHVAWERAVVEPWRLGLAEGVPGPSPQEVRSRRAGLERLDTPEARAAVKRLRAYARRLGEVEGGLPAQDALELTVEALELQARGAHAVADERARQALVLDPDFAPARLLLQELEAGAAPEPFLERADDGVHPPAVRLAVKSALARALGADAAELEAEVGRLERVVSRAAALGVDLTPFAAAKRALLRGALASSSDVSLAVRAGDTRVLDLLLQVAHASPAVPPDDLVAAASSVLRDFVAAPRQEEGPVWLAQGVRLGGWLWRAGGRATVRGSEDLLAYWCEGLTLDLRQRPLDDPRTATEVALAYLHFGRSKPSKLVATLGAPGEVARLLRLWPESVAATYLLAIRDDADPANRVARLDRLGALLRAGEADLGPAALPRAHVAVAEHLVGTARQPGCIDREARLRLAVEHARLGWTETQPALWLASASSEAEALEGLGQPAEGLARRRALVDALAKDPDFGLGFFDDEHEAKATVRWLAALNGLGRHEEVIAQRALLEAASTARHRRAEVAGEVSSAHRALGQPEAARALLPLLEEHAPQSLAVALEAARLCIDLGEPARARALLGHVGPQKRQSVLTAIERLERRQRR